MEAQILRPQRNVIEIKGKLIYTESIGAWNSIRFKKELINEFPQLKEKRSAFSYKMTFYQEYKELEKAIRKILSIPSRVRVLSIITLGYPARTMEQVSERLPVEEISFSEKWNG